MNINTIRTIQIITDLLRHCPRVAPQVGSGEVETELLVSPVRPASVRSVSNSPPPHPPSHQLYTFGKQISFGRLDHRFDSVQSSFRVTVRLVVVKTTLSDMEYSRLFNHEDCEGFSETVVRDVLERPVPVVVIKLTELSTAAQYLLPLSPSEGHPHVVLGGDPLRHLHRLPPRADRPAMISPETQNVDPQLLFVSDHEREEMEEVRGEKMILFQEEDEAGVVPDDGQAAEHVVGLPPPVMLGLTELGLSVVPEGVRPGRVSAGPPLGLRPRKELVPASSSLSSLSLSSSSSLS